MILALICGVGIGTAILLFSMAFAPPRTDLVAAVGRFESQRNYKATNGAIHDHETWRGRLGGWLVTELRQRGISLTRQRKDLALVDRTLEEHLTAKAILGVFGLLLPSLFTGVLTVAGISLPLAVPAASGLLLGAVLFVLPDLSLITEARTKRDELRRALSCYLDLVSMTLAGGRGAPEALPMAAEIGRGWAFKLIGKTLERARYGGITPWEALGDLGERVDMPELRDLGSALSLVAHDGAKVRQSLTARAATQRRRQLAEAAGEAEKGDQTIQLAQIVLAAGFLLFLCYPAVVNVLVL